MEGEPGAARVVPAGRVDQQYVKRLLELPGSRRKKLPLAESQQSCLVGAAGSSPHSCSLDEPPGLHHRRAGPADVAGPAGPGAAPLETDEDTGDSQSTPRGVSAQRTCGRDTFLKLFELPG